MRDLQKGCESFVLTLRYDYCAQLWSSRWTFRLVHPVGKEADLREFVVAEV